MDVGFIDYRTDFDHPETGVYFHWWDKAVLRNVAGTVAPHTHNHYEFLFLTQGAVLHMLNGDTERIDKGGIAFIKPGETHAIFPFEGRASQHANVSVIDESLRPLCAALGEDVYERLMAAPPILRLGFEEAADFRKDIEKITMVPARDIAGTTLAIKKVLVDLIAFYCETRAESAGYPDWFRDLLTEIRKPSNAYFRAKDVYDLAGYSPVMTNCYFRTFTGKTVTAYLRDVKLGYACSLLEKTSFTTLQIANLLGITSLSHFNHIFKEYVGKSPLEYRNAF